MIVRIFSSLVILLNSYHAIPCDFKYVEFDPSCSENISESIDLACLKNAPRSLPNESFDCFEKDVRLKSQERTTKPPVDQQYIFANSPDDSDYEDIESTCQVSRRTIQPRALNNIYNKLTKVINTSSFVQSITIEQCLSKHEPCYSGSNPPIGKKHICRQKHVKITLKALGEGNVIVDEQFYYPSHCVCELVRIKKKHKKCFNVERNKN